MVSTEEYRKDIQSLLDLLDANNGAVITQAIALVSKYAGQQLTGGPGAATPAGPTTKTAAPQTAATEPRPPKPKRDIHPEKRVAAVIYETKPTTPKRQPAQPAAATKPTTPAVKPKRQPVQEKPKIYPVERQLIGAKIAGHYVSEKIVRALALNGGDLVQFDRTANKADLAKAIKRVKQNVTPDRTIHRVSRGVLATAKGLPAGYTLIARVDDRQHVLLATADQQAYQFLIHPQDIERLHLTAGDKVDLAWHEAEGPQTAVVTWVHHDPQPAATTAATQATTSTESAPTTPA